MKIKKYGIYHLSKSKANNKYGGHDIIVTKKGFKKVKYKNLTSLEYIDNKGNILFDLGAIKNAKKGRITILPHKALKGNLWQGIYNSEHKVNKKDLDGRIYSKIEQLNKKYRKHIN